MDSRVDIVDIRSLPVGQPLERPLQYTVRAHKRKTSSRGRGAKVAKTAPPKKSKRSADAAAEGTVPDVPSSSGTDAGSSPKKTRRDDFFSTYGSESDSEESDGEELLAPVVPRTLRIVMDTPLDPDATPSTSSYIPSTTPSIAFQDDVLSTSSHIPTTAASIAPQDVVPSTSSHIPTTTPSIASQDDVLSTSSHIPTTATSIAPQDVVPSTSSHIPTTTPSIAPQDDVPYTNSHIPTTSASPLKKTQPIVETGQSFYDFQWTPFPNPPVPPERRREMFHKNNVGPTTPCADPYETFIAIWDQRIMEHIVLETNRYAQEVAQKMLDSNALAPGSRISKWSDTTVHELYVYFAIILAMGIVVKTRVMDYWSTTQDIFYTPGFSVQMSYNRFVLLNMCLHFDNNEDICARELDVSEAKLLKIKTLMSHLNKKFSSMYNLNQNIAIDESLLQWKGMLDIGQFIPNKAAQFGIKSYEICETQTGYLWRFMIHANKEHQVKKDNPDPLEAFTSTIVLKLLQGLESKGHTVWMDSFYNSPALARRLKTLGFDCVGTLRTNRRFVPSALHNLTKENMRPGQIAGLTSGDVDVMVWRGQNRVAMISTYHGNAVAERGHLFKPILIYDYIVTMGCVDKKDQMLAAYPIERKRTNVWYKKIFRRLLNVSVLNAYILCKQSSSSHDHRSFRVALIQSIIDKHSSMCVKVKPQTPLKAHTQVYEAKEHYLAELPFMPNGSSRIRRTCKLCSKRVRTYCVGCDKNMCMIDCFKNFHS